MSTNIVGNEVVQDAPIAPDQSPTFTNAPNLFDLTDMTLNPDYGFKARAYRATNQAIATSTPTKAQFNTESYDGSENYDNATNYRFTCTRPGWYYIFTKVYMSGLGDGKTLTVGIYKNGSLFSQAKNTGGASSDMTCFNSDLLRLNKNDYIEVFVEHNHGSDRDIDAGEGQSFVLVHLIR